jgi:HAD superfamily hydrolase (TIGR01490 family)
MVHLVFQVAFNRSSPTTASSTPILGSVSSMIHAAGRTPESTGRPGSRSAAFFDLDKTIIAKSSVMAFGRPFYRGGLINRRTMIKSTYAQIMYLMGGADHDQMERMRAHFAELSRGWEVAQVKLIVAQALQDLIGPLIYSEAAALIDEHHAAGRDVVIVSSSGIEVVEPIGVLLDADRVIATRLAVEHGHFTGQIDYYAYGPAKATAMVELAEAHGYDLADSFGYSDSATDLPLLEAVGRPCAVNPDRTLRKVAVERGWPILDFTNPVPLRSRMGLGASYAPAIAAAGVTVGAATAGLAWYARRKHRDGQHRRAS